MAIASYAGPAFTVWTVSLALAVLVHEWAAVERPWSVHLVTGVAALAVLLRPAAVWRTMALLGCCFAEFVHTLPVPYNDQLLVGLTGGVVTVWWLVQSVRAPSVARDPAAVFDKIAPFLRSAFLVAAFAAAFARLNTGFLATLGTCAPRFFDEIPLLRLPQQSYPAVAVVMVLVRFAIPTLLLFRRTRRVGVALGLGYCLVLAVGGDPALSSSMWAFLLLFMPTGTLARSAATLRGRVLRYHWRRYGPALTSPLTWLLLSALFVAGLSLMELAPQALSGHLHQRLSALGGLLWLLLWTWLLIRHRAHWWDKGSTDGGLRVRSAVLLAGLTLIVLNVLSPYLGLKTQYSFVEWSNLRTEPGGWNHLVVPEAVRLFGLQERRVHLVEGGGPPRLVEVVDKFDEQELVLADARRLAAGFPGSTLYYELDGRQRLAAPIAEDPVLGRPPGPVLRLLGGFRRIPIDGSCTL